MSPALRRRGRAGFTLIELLIVIAIILAIGGLVLVNTLRASGRADSQLTQAQIQEALAAQTAAAQGGQDGA